MADYISRDDAVCIADYAVDEHPYGKDRTRPETYSDYNQGWNDACDYIRGKLETAKPADVEPVVRCRECINFTKTAVNGKGFRICPASGMDITPDDYCSYGQHKDQFAQVRKMEDSHNVTKENT